MNYIPATQMNPHEFGLVNTWFQPSWIVRAAAPVNGLPEQLQRGLSSADPGLPFSGFYSVMELEARTLSTRRVEVALASAMGALALVLSTLGIFALVASTVAQRTREIGIRNALGSSMAQAMVHVDGPGVRASIAGLVVGLVLSVASLGLMQSVHYGVADYDGLTMGMLVFSLLAVTLLAATLPVSRIARIDPAIALRDQ
jgi:ABC-type antimicrobial peptide transport system permease subunit